MRRSRSGWSAERRAWRLCACLAGLLGVFACSSTAAARDSYGWDGTIAIESTAAIDNAIAPWTSRVSANFSDFLVLKGGYGSEHAYSAIAAVSYEFDQATGCYGFPVGYNYRLRWTIPAHRTFETSVVEPLFRGGAGWPTAQLTENGEVWPGGTAFRLIEQPNGELLFWPHFVVFNAPGTVECQGTLPIDQAGDAGSYEPGTFVRAPTRPLVDDDPSPDRVAGSTTFTLANPPYPLTLGLTGYSYKVTYDLHRRPTPPGVICDDGQDNDGDTLVDLNDPGCADRNDPSEQGDADEESGGGGPDQDTEPPAQACPLARARLGTVEAVASCFVRRGNLFVLKSGVRMRIAGIDLTPAVGEITLDPQTRSVRGNAEVRFGNVIVYRGRLDWQVDELISISQSGQVAIGGLKINGDLAVRIVSPTSAEVSAGAALPEKFGGVSGSMKFSLTMERGLVLDQAKLGVGSVPIGVGRLRDASLAYESTANGPRWTGAATLDLPTFSIGGTIVWLNGAFSSADFELRRPTPIGATGLFLDEVRVGLSLDPFAVRGGATVTAGPRLAGRAFVSARGDIELRLAAPMAISVEGSMTLAGELKIASAAMRVDAAGWASLEGKAGWEIPGVKLNGRIGGYVSRDAAELTGAVDVTLLDATLGAEGVVSDRGVAACRRGWGPDVGFGYRWGSSLPVLFGGSCDLAPWRATRSERRLLAATESSVVRIDSGARTAVFLARGTTAPPLIVVTGPGGARYETPADSTGRNDQDAFIASDATTNTTYVAVRNPPAGTWTVSRTGDTPVREFAATHTQPALGLRVAIRRQAGRRVIDYRYTPAPGRSVTLIDRAGNVRRTIATLRTATGTIPLRTPPNLDRRHEIVAVVSQGGLPVDLVVAARYRSTPPAAPPAPTRARVRVQGARAVVSWRKAPRAVAYGVTLTAPNGRRTWLRTTNATVRLALPTLGRYRVAIRGVDAFGRNGRVTTVTADRE